MEHLILWGFFILFILFIPFWIRIHPIKDWIIAFFFKAFLSGFIDSFVVAYDKVEYPVRFLAEIFEINILFDLLVFPTICVFYNITTKDSTLMKILVQGVVYALGIVILEYFLVTYTNLLKYTNWTIFHSFFYLFLTLLLVRGIIAWIRKIADS